LAGESNDQWSQVATSRFGKPLGTKYATVKQLEDTWDGEPIYNWSKPSPNVLVQSALVCTVDLDTTPSLAGVAVYLAVQARLPPSPPPASSSSVVRLALGIDPGDGIFRYSDNDGSAAPTSSAGRWETFSYQAVLNATGTARFALFNWQKIGPTLAAAEAVQMSGLLVVAPVGARFNTAGGEQ
jgi:hypothetical protein